MSINGVDPVEPVEPREVLVSIHDPEPTAELTEAKKRVKQTTKWYELIKTLLIGVTVLFATITMFAVLILLTRVDETTVSTNRYGERLVDCTTPGHKCYDDGLKNQAEAIESLNKITIYATFCAKTLPPTITVEEMQKCIQARITKEGG